MRIEGYGISIDIPDDWHGEVRVPEADPESEGALLLPYLHVANFPMPSSRGTTGTGAAAVMPDTGIFGAMVEQHPDQAGVVDFAPGWSGRPRGRSEFAKNRFNGPGTDALGHIVTFTTAGRPFAAFLLLGTEGSTINVRLDQLNDAIRTLRIEPRQ